MKRTMIFGMIVCGVVALATGCNSAPAERDYHEYSDIRGNQHGSGDAIGNSLATRGAMSYPKAANPRYVPPRQTDMAATPQD